jgi:glycosyltransferase involved in cell wall biosynthesis
MRILQVTEASGSGTFEVLRTISAGATAAGHQVLVALGARPETPQDPASLLPAVVELALLPWASRDPRSQLKAARALRQLAAGWRPDVVHLHSSFAGVVGALALPHGLPIVYTSHGSPTGRRSDAWPKRGAYRAAESLVARRATVVGAVSEADADVARRLLGARRVEVIPNGIADLDPGHPMPAPERADRRVVAVGRISAQRRPAETAQILGAVRDLASVRWIGGAADGEDEPLRAALVPVTGWLAHDDALAQLAQATVVVHWSGWDGMSLALLEAMARDVVVVASDIPANREVIGPDQVCATVPEAIALVRSVLTDDDARSSLLAAQRARGERYGAARSAAAWLDLYAQIARQS